jgi:TonB family protein
MTTQKPVSANDHAIDPNNYPLLSMMNGEAGNVVLDFRINTDGSVGDVKVARSSGFAALDGAAGDAVAEHWRYKPLLSGDHPVSCRHQAQVAWRIPVDPALFASYGYAVVQMHTSDYPAGISPRTAEGITGVMLTIGKDGAVLEERIVHSSGYPELDSALMAAAKNGKWKIAPAAMNGTPLRCAIGLLIEWSQ